MTLFKFNRYSKLITAMVIAAFLAAIAIAFVVYAKGRSGVLADDCEMLDFSAESGFYDGDFELTIKSPVGQVHYTLDGSVPDENSPVYTGPVHISDLSGTAGIYSGIADVSAEYHGDLIEESLKAQNKAEDDTDSYSDDSCYICDNPIDKATVVRARAYAGNAACTDIKTAVYFVGYQDKPEYKDIKIMSIVTDPDNLFSSDKGIYVCGDTFYDYIKSGEYLGENWHHWLANYSMHGSEWERECDCQFFDGSHKLLLSQEGGLRIHGQASRTFRQKSFSLRADKEYDGNSRILYPLLNDENYYGKLCISQGGNDKTVKLKDYLMESLCSDMNFVTQTFVPYAVFLNGEYWGLYYISQKYDDPSYYQNRFGIYEDNLVVIKDEYMEEGMESDYDLYGEMKKFCTQADMTDGANYEKACEYIDIDSYIDYFATMIYIARWKDWPGANLAVWRSRKIQNDSYGDGRWRWIFFDLNGEGFTSEYITADPLKMANYDPMFVNMYKNDEFRQKLNERVLELGDTVFKPERVNEFIDRYNEELYEQLKLTHYRFSDTDFDTVYNEEVSSIKDFFAHRKEFLEKYFEADSTAFLH